MRTGRLMMICLAVTLLAASARAQQESADDSQPEQKRIFGIIPNYRTSPPLLDYRPLTSTEKFAVAADDAFDRGTFILAALFAAQGQLAASEPSFGQGVPAYARYYAASATDWIVGDLMTEAIFPAMLHQDPRYFRRGTGSRWSRLGYAMGQIFQTRTDSGGTAFNFSEICGNATATAIGNAYYPDSRTASGNVSKFAIQIGVDMASNILKEFSPDLLSLFSRDRPSDAQ